MNPECRRPRRLLAGAMGLLLAACGGAPTRHGEHAEVGAYPPGESPSARKSGNKPVQKRGGAYYKDDGPADEIPVDLDAIPDAVPRAEPLHSAANRPYVVLGKSYVPNTTLKPLEQRGVASWYGKKFHGQKTSIGEPYDMFSMTAAHPTLAIPSYVKVTNANNGRSVVVRVTDRGPFLAERIIDLSYAAAYRLGYVDNGSTLVEVRSILPGDATGLSYAQLKPPDPPSTKPAAARSERDEIEDFARRLAAEETLAVVSPRSSTTQHGVFLQLGAFLNADNAESLRAHFTRELDWLNESIQINVGGGIHRVHLGPYPNRAEAEKVAEKIRLALGQKPGIVTR
jgi:rare lipoprotein A